MGFERLDEKSGMLEIDPKKFFFVVYDIGCTEYHLQLLDNCFYSKGRSRNETNLLVDTSLRVNGRDWEAPLHLFRYQSYHVKTVTLCVELYGRISSTMMS